MITFRTPPVWNAISLPGAGLTIRQLAARTASMAVRALLREAEAGPKPGLVDRFGPGVHCDMDISHFRLSAAALGPFFESITLESALFMARPGQTCHGTAEEMAADTANDHTDGTADTPATLAKTLRDLGLQAESAMLSTTGGVNTHKGAIWTMGLLCAAVGSLRGYGYRNAASIFPASDSCIKDTAAQCRPSLSDALDTEPGCVDTGSGCGNAEAVCAKAAGLAHAILSIGTIGSSPDCRTSPSPGSITQSGSGGIRNSSPHAEVRSTAAPHVGTGSPSRLTKGLSARQAYGLRSARDEALEGFPSLQSKALPLARSLHDSGLPEDEKVISVLLAVMCELDDTCLVARGGLTALQMAKASARQVLDGGGPCSGEGSNLYRNMVADFKAQGLSPGGSADLCAAALFLAELEVPAQAIRL